MPTRVGTADLAVIAAYLLVIVGVGCHAGLVKRKVIYSSVYLLVAALIPRDRGGVFLGFIIFAAGTTALNYFYIRYFQELGARVQLPRLRA